jgi:serralysin
MLNSIILPHDNEFFFVYRKNKNLTDFQSGDKINLYAIDANSLIKGDQAFQFIGTKSFTAAGQVRFADGVLSANVDADLGADFAIDLIGVKSLFVSDMYL